MPNRSHLLFGILVPTILLVSVLAVQRNSISGVVVAQRDKPDGGSAVLIRVDGSEESRIDEIRLTFRRSLETPLPGHLPQDWSINQRGRKLRLTGPGAALPLHIRLDRAAPTNLGREVRVQVFNAGKKLMDLKKLAVSELPPVQVAGSLRGVVLLPPVVSPGELISARVLDSGRTPKEGTWSLNGATARNQEVGVNTEYSFMVEIPAKVQTSGTESRRTPTPPDDEPAESLRLVYTDPWGEVTVDVREPSSVQVVPALVGSGEATVRSCSPWAFSGKQLCVCGFFPQPASNYDLVFDGSLKVDVLAASSRALYVRVPEDLPNGEHRVGGQPDSLQDPGECRFRSVTLRGEIDSASLMRGESTEMRLTIEGTEEPLEVAVSNQTPEVIRLAGGETQTLRTTGGSANSVVRSVRGLRPGNFNIIYELGRERCSCVQGALVDQGSGEDAPIPVADEDGSPAQSEAEESEAEEREETGVEAGSAEQRREQAAAPRATYGKYRDCTPEEVADDLAADPIAPFLTDPEEARERQKLRRQLAEEARLVDYWSRLCKRLPADQKTAEENRIRLAAIQQRLISLAQELGATLPAECGEEPCNKASCCENLDAAKAADREAFRLRLRCLIGRFRSTHRKLQDTGSDFSWLIDRWREGADHRAAMGFYDDLFSGLHDVIDTLTTSLGDRVKELIKDELTAAGCRELGLSEADCGKVRESIQAAQGAKGAIDEVTDLVKQGTLSPAFIVKMVDSMAQAAGNAARVGVEGWQRFKEEMNSKLIEEYRYLLCLIETNQALRDLSANCQKFCSRAVESLLGHIETEQKKLEQLDLESRQAAAARIDQLADQLINPHFAAATSTADRDWINTCCQAGAGEQTVGVPGDSDCAKILEKRLKAELGPLYCYLREITITVDCGPGRRLKNVQYSYQIDAHPRPGCCLRPVAREAPSR